MAETTKHKPTKKSQSIYLDEDYVAAVDTIAERTGRNKSQVIASYLKTAVDELNSDSEKPMIITVMSFKGGVAKTTSAANLALCLGADDHKVLVIDLDGQGSISQYLGVYDMRAEDPCIADVMLTNSRGVRSPLEAVIKETAYENVYIVPSSFRFSDADSKIRSEAAPGVDSRLQYAIEDLLKTQKYDYIIIDCPPSLGLVVTNAITALEAGNGNSMIMIPVRVDGFAIAGLSNTLNTIESVARERRTPMRQWKLLRTIAERRSVAYKEGLKLINEQFKNAQFFTSVISKGTAVVESTLAMQPLMVYDPQSKPATDYRQLAGEIEDLNV